MSRGCAYLIGGPADLQKHAIKDAPPLVWRVAVARDCDLCNNNGAPHTVHFRVALYNRVAVVRNAYIYEFDREERQ